MVDVLFSEVVVYFVVYFVIGEMEDEEFGSVWMVCCLVIKGDVLEWSE